jgi:hypothetical protein
MQRTQLRSRFFFFFISDFSIMSSIVAGGEVSGLDYTYKILPSAPPDPLPHALPVSALDAEDGFLHTSPVALVRTTADRFFGDANQLWLLKINITAVRADSEGAGRVVWEPRGFVHLYGREAGSFARLGAGVIDGVRAIERRNGQTWSDVLDALEDGWLVDTRTEK